MSDHERIAERERGALAAQVTNNPVYQDAFARMEANLRDHMESSASTDEVVLEAKRALVILRRIHKHLEDAMTTGKMAAIQLERSSG